MCLSVFSGFVPDNQVLCFELHEFRGHGLDGRTGLNPGGKKVGTRYTVFGAFRVLDWAGWCWMGLDGAGLNPGREGYRVSACLQKLGRHLYGVL